MTLLEVLVALVITALTAGGFLGVFQGVQRAAGQREAWAQVSDAAESAMEATRAGGAALADERARRDGLTRRIVVRAHPGGVDEWVVTVRHRDGTSLTLTRLERRR